MKRKNITTEDYLIDQIIEYVIGTDDREWDSYKDFCDENDRDLKDYEANTDHIYAACVLLQKIRRAK